MDKTIALLGGSFNPPHQGHLQMSSYIQKTLCVDETWMLFSINPDKHPDDYASLQHRMNMADILVKHYNAPVVLSDLEDQIAREKGKYDTYYILEGLRERFPDHKFIWVMGADSFSTFHTWKERDDIMKDHIIAVVDRPGYTDKALNSQTAKDFADQMIDLTDPCHLQTAKTGWCFLNSPKIDVSSSGILENLREGKTDFAEPFDLVADYIYQHGLYGTAQIKTIPAQSLSLALS